jgi:winged helix-turn helix protein
VTVRDLGFKPHAERCPSSQRRHVGLGPGLVNEDQTLTRADRHRLEAIVSDRSAPQKHVWRANIILATAEGCGTAEIMRRSGKSKPVVWRWQARFMAEGVEGLLRDKTRKPGRQPLPAGSVQRVVNLALGPRREKQPTGPAGCWRRPQG